MFIMAKPKSVIQIEMSIEITFQIGCFIVHFGTGLIDFQSIVPVINLLQTETCRWNKTAVNIKRGPISCCRTWIYK